MIENVSTQLTVFHCFAHCLLPGRAFASLYVLLFLEKEAEIGGRGLEIECVAGFSLCCVLEHYPQSSALRWFPDMTTLFNGHKQKLCDDCLMNLRALLLQEEVCFSHPMLHVIQVRQSKTFLSASHIFF